MVSVTARQHQERLRKRLRANAQDLGRVDREQTKLRAKRAELIRRASDAGIGVMEMAELTGLSRRAIYDVLKEES